MEELKEGWRRVKLDEVVDFNPENLNNNNNLEFINYLDTANVTEGRIAEIKKLYPIRDKIPSRAKRIVQINDVIYSSVRPNLKHYGILKKIEKNLIVSTGFIVLRTKCLKISPNYLYNFLRLEKNIEFVNGIAETSTTTYPSITSKVLENLEINLPPLETQEKIALILSSLDDKIEINNEMNKTLEEMAQTLFKRWFIDFDFPNEKGEPYKSSGGKMIDSELGEIPEGWGVKTLNDVIEKIIDNRGKTPTKTEFGIPLIEGNNIFLNKTIPILSSKQKYVSNETYETWFRSGHPKYLDILCATVGTLPKWCFTPKNTKLCIAQNIIAIRSHSLFSAYYLKMYMDTENFIKRFEGRIIRTAQPSIKVGHLISLLICIPSKKILKEFDNIVKGIFEKNEINQKEIQSLTEIRDTLLPKLMSGEIEV